MNVIVDTPIWSRAYRRRVAVNSPVVTELIELIGEGRVILIGPVRQELLSGIRHELQFHKLRSAMRAFEDLGLETEDYETAAAFSNSCMARGIQGSHVDFLICAVAARRRCEIFTDDGDFARFARVLPVQLHQPRAA